MPPLTPPNTRWCLRGQTGKQALGHLTVNKGKVWSLFLLKAGSTFLTLPVIPSPSVTVWKTQKLRVCVVQKTTQDSNHWWEMSGPRVQSESQPPSRKRGRKQPTTDRGEAVKLAWPGEKPKHFLIRPVGCELVLTGAETQGGMFLRTQYTPCKMCGDFCVSCNVCPVLNLVCWFTQDSKKCLIYYQILNLPAWTDQIHSVTRVRKPYSFRMELK